VDAVDFQRSQLAYSGMVWTHPYNSKKRAIKNGKYRHMAKAGRTFEAEDNDNQTTNYFKANCGCNT
jgi:hypothetical protein